MKQHDLSALIRDNPRAAKQELEIREAISELRKLRASGVSGGGYSLTEPFGGKNIPSRVPAGKKTQYRDLKLSFGA